MKRIGIFGGAFNPIHYGHLRTAQEVLESLFLEKVIFIPTCNPPFNKPEMEDFDKRLEMVRRAIKGNRKFQLSDIEKRSKGKSYTIDTVKKLIQIFPEGELFLIMGIDSFLDLPLWKNPDDLVRLVNIVVISRPGHEFVDAYKSPFIRAKKRDLIDLDRGMQEQIEYRISESTSVYMLNVTDIDISASYIRTCIKKGRDIRYLLPDSVKSYIISNNLYK